MRLDEAVAYVMDVEFVWGYQATIAGLTKTPPPYTYPPPTTLLGAVAEAVARSEGLGESSLTSIMNCLTEDLIAVALKPINCIPVKYQDINRVIAVRESGGSRYPSAKNPQGSFDAPARGKTVLVSLNGEAPRIRWVLAWRRSPTLPAGAGRARLRPEHLWRVHRVGSKESLASVINVVREAPKPINRPDGGEVVTTTYSFPLRAVATCVKLVGDWVVEQYADPFKPYGAGRGGSPESPALRYLRGDTTPFASPVLSARCGAPVAHVRLSERGVALRVGSYGTVLGVVRG